MKSLKHNDIPLQFVFLTTKLRRSQKSSPKCPTGKFMRSNVVYSFNCSGCDTLYVSQTSRHLTTRLDEHARRGTPVECHLEYCGAPKACIRATAKILDYSPVYDTLLTLEALHISKLQPAMNTRDEFRSKELVHRLG